MCPKRAELLLFGCGRRRRQIFFDAFVFLRFSLVRLVLVRLVLVKFIIRHRFSFSFSVLFARIVFALKTYALHPSDEAGQPSHRTNGTDSRLAWEYFSACGHEAVQHQNMR